MQHLFYFILEAFLKMWKILFFFEKSP